MPSHGQPSKEQKLSLKRKRDDQSNPNNDPKFQEYLEVMQPTSKSRTWANEQLPGRKSEQQAVSIDDGSKVGAVGQVKDEADSEYQSVPKMKEHKAPKVLEQAPPTSPGIISAQALPENAGPGSATEDSQRSDTEVRAATDDDWLRSRTSRLLGLVDDDEDDPSAYAKTLSLEEKSKGEALSIKEASGPKTLSANGQPEDEEALQGVSAALPTDDIGADATAATDRLFIRNLPYVATESDLQQLFQHIGHGHIEEVRGLYLLSPRFQCSMQFLMNILIGTTYAMHVMSSRNSILVDALRF